MSAPFVIDQKAPASEALTKLLLNAQLDHRHCVSKALQEKHDVVDKCALTWGEVHLRYQAWAAYRAPFQTEEATKIHTEFWTKKRVTEYEKKLQ